MEYVMNLKKTRSALFTFSLKFIIINTLTVSLDVSIHECQWQLLSVHL